MTWCWPLITWSRWAKHEFPLLLPFTVAGVHAHIDTTQTARVRISNEGVLNSRFTVKTEASTTSSTSSEALPSAAVGHPSGVPTPEHNEERLDATSGDSEPNPVVGAAGTGVVDPRSDEKSREAALLAKASAVGDAGMKYPDGRGAIEVVEESGELAGYGSAEIVIVFAPLTVGDFQMVKVGGLADPAKVKDATSGRCED